MSSFESEKTLLMKKTCFDKFIGKYVAKEIALCYNVIVIIQLFKKSAISSLIVKKNMNANVTGNKFISEWIA